MAVPNNILQTVQTFQKSSLAYLLNLCCHVSTANTKFKDFQKETSQLGSSVTFDLPPRASVAQGLVWTTQPAAQRPFTLTADQANNASFSVTNQEVIFNLTANDYINVFCKSFLLALANQVEGNIAKNWDSSVVSQLDGTTNTASGPYRFFGDGSTPLSSYNQLASANMFFKNYGAVASGMKQYLPDTVIPSIIGTGLNQFAPDRNNKDAMSWEIGNFGTPPVTYYQSNLMPIHTSGNSGVNGDVFTIVSTNDPTGQNVTQLTVTTNGTSTDADAVLSGDLLQFQDGVSGKPNMRYLTFIGQFPSANPVQMRVTADAGSTSGTIVLNITPSLNWAGGQNQNLNNPISAGMKLLTFPSHRCGGILGDNALFMAMPQMPKQPPYDTANEYDDTTGCSIRLTYGAIIGQNQMRYGYDEIHGSCLVPEYSMRLLVPLSQG